MIVLTFSVNFCFNLGKELGNCTHQRKTNDDTNTLALSTFKSSSGKRRKVDNKRRKKEVEKRTDEEGATFFFYLKET